jgi:hypothetical protein
MRRIYIAGRYSRREEFNTYADELRSRGATIDARWLTGAHDSAFTMKDIRAGDRAGIRHAQKAAAEDLRDVMRSNMLLSFTENDDAGYTSGGRHVEFGVAYVNGLTLVIVGPRENVFHCHGVAEVFPDFGAFVTSDYFDRWMLKTGIR